MRFLLCILSPPQNLDAIALILQSAMGTILDCYDPRIRNSESHLSTEVDAKNQQVLFYDDTNGKHEFLVKYSFVELADMTNKLQNNLFLALAFTAYVEWRTMLLVITLKSGCRATDKIRI